MEQLWHQSSGPVPSPAWAHSHCAGHLQAAGGHKTPGRPLQPLISTSCVSEATFCGKHPEQMENFVVGVMLMVNNCPPPPQVWGLLKGFRIKKSGNPSVRPDPTTNWASSSDSLPVGVLHRLGGWFLRPCPALESHVGSSC